MFVCPKISIDGVADGSDCQCEGKHDPGCVGSSHVDYDRPHGACCVWRTKEKAKTWSMAMLSI